MKIRWLGHSSFRIENEQGGVLITDPFDASVGYPTPRRRADVVTVSHEHHDHNCLDFTDCPRVIHGLEEKDAVEAAGFTIRGVDTFHDPEQGKKRGKNRVFLIQADGVTIAHLGDLGHPLAPDQYEAIGHPQALMIPVGGFFTIDTPQAWRIARDICPAVVIPMHYKTDWMSFPITDAEEFVRLAGGAKRGMEEIDLRPETLPDSMQVFLPALYREP